MTDLMTAGALIRSGEAVACAGAAAGVRFVLSQQGWYDMAHALPRAPGLVFTALWADATHVHALFHDPAPVVASVPVEAGLYAGLSPARPGAALFERAVADLWGHQAADAVDTRPWLDHGVWPLLRPLSDRPVPNVSGGEEPDYPETLEEWDGESGVAVPIGPLPPTAPGLGPAYWRAMLAGGTMRSVEARLGWAHRGVLGAMRGKAPANAARFAARIEGAATVAHSLAFARAVEAAVGFEPPPAAVGLRALMLATERVGTGLWTLQAVAAASGGAHEAAVAGRELLLAGCAAAFGHRLMMDAVRPGGVAAEPDVAALLDLDDALAGIGALRGAWPWWRPTIGADLGRLALPDALALGLDGPFGRASGRQDPGWPEARLRLEGTIAARMDLLVDEIEADIERARTQLGNLPAGAIAGVLPHREAEGLGLAAGPHGAVHHWVRLAHGSVVANFAASPAWLHVPAIERAAAGMPFDRLGALVASFGLNPAGMDL